MITTRKISNLSVLAASAALVSSTQAQPINSLVAPPAPAPGPEPTGVEKAIKDIKQPCKEFNWGGDFRLRNEYMNNGLTLDDGRALHEQDYFRFRGRLWASIMPIPDLSLNTRLSAEPRLWMDPSYARTKEGLYTGRTGTEWRYGMFDLLNIQWKNIAGQPLTLTVGRQDIMVGEPMNWWLMADGTPGDGSWTFFLDAARLTYEAKEIKTRFDAMYIYQNADPGAWLPTINDARHGGNPLTEQNEQGVAFFVSNKSIEKVNLDGYFIYKRDQAKFSYGDFGDIYTVGGKVSGALSEHLEYAAEGAYQFGHREMTSRQAPNAYSPNTWFKGPREDISAFGLNSRLTYLVKDPLKNRFRLDFEYLSGDDRGTPGTYEGFDDLWGRWPRWSELFIYTGVPEYGRVAQIGNIIRFGPAWEISPVKNLDFHAEYNALFADHQFSNPLTGIGAAGYGPGANGASNAGLPASGGFSDGYFRGHYLQTILKYKFNQHLSGHLWGEFLWMGDYYHSTDLMSFLRAEVMLTF